MHFWHSYCLSCSSLLYFPSHPNLSLSFFLFSCTELLFSRIPKSNTPSFILSSLYMLFFTSELLLPLCHFFAYKYSIHLVDPNFCLPDSFKQCEVLLICALIPMFLRNVSSLGRNPTLVILPTTHSIQSPLLDMWNCNWARVLEGKAKSGEN